MSESTPKVSVLIPVYNAEEFIIKSIDSILNQTFTDFELILLDDASTDRSLNLIEKISDPRIKIYKNKKNLGISQSRNKLMELAKGEYLAIMDNDDLSCTKRLEKQVTYLDSHPDVSMLGTWGELFNKTPQKTLFGDLKKFILSFGWVWCQMQSPTLEDMLHGNVTMHSSMMIRKKDIVAKQIRYNELYTPAEDFDLIKQAMFKGLKVVNLPEVLFKYNLHGNNFSLQRKAKMKEADSKIKQEVAAFLQQKYKKYPYFLVILKKLRPKYFIRKRK